MKKTSKGYKLIAFNSLIAWLKPAVPGILLSLVCIGTAIWLLASNNPPEAQGFKFYFIFTKKPWVTALLILSCIFPILYVLVANKYAINTLMSQVWSNKLSGFIVPKVHSYLETLSERQPDWMQGITNSKFTQLCLDIVMQDGTLNKVQRLVLRTGFKGINMKASDFEDPEYKLPHVVVTKMENLIASLTQPSLLFFWILLILQLVALFLALILTR
jgi:hypothetical protein